MKNIYSGMYKSLIIRTLSILFFFFLTLNITSAQDGRTPGLDEGMQLFKEKCAACHAKNMKDRLVGPGLKGVDERWGGDREKLHQWIVNSAAFLTTGDKYANDLFEEYSKLPMTPFTELSKEQTDNIIDYVNKVADGGGYPPAPAATASASAGGGQERTAELDEGMKLFKEKCASCHDKKMKSKMTGPALKGVEDRWGGDKEKLHQWIRNSQAYITSSGDSYAADLYAEYGTVMTSFPDLTDKQIDNILSYIGVVSRDGMYPMPSGGDVVTNEPVKPKGSNNLMYGMLALILAILSFVLARMISNMNNIARAKAGLPAAARQSLWKTIAGSSAVSILIFAAVIWGGYQTVNNAIDLGRSQGYAPEQPIKFSHKTHAGDNQIDCQYCHDGARRSKHSIIPAANTCMNCHKAIKKGSTYGTAELTKIFASIGFNPNKNAYIQDYDNMDEADIEALYKKWITDNFISDYNDAAEKEGKEKITELNAEGERVVKEQWQGIVSALKDDLDGKIQGPINWVRIHSLPDHVYYNHSQHVTVGKQKCQTCHGPVEEMKVLAQYAPLSMGWCVNCHRETKVDFKENDYYASWANYRQEIKEGKRTGVTVAEVGGIECQKCHY